MLIGSHVILNIKRPVFVYDVIQPGKSRHLVKTPEYETGVYPLRGSGGCFMKTDGRTGGWTDKKMLLP